MTTAISTNSATGGIAASRAAPAPLRRAWQLFALACFSWFVGMLIWDYQELVLHRFTPFPAWPDAFYFLFAAFMALGVFFYRDGTPGLSVTLLEASQLGIFVSCIVIAHLAVFAQPLRVAVSGGPVSPAIHDTLALLGRERVLARRALDDGADAVEMAGGDGSLGLVAEVARERDVPCFCVPVGTRNHFALDLGLKRDDPLWAPRALSNGDELRIDVGSATPADQPGRLTISCTTLVRLGVS